MSGAGEEDKKPGDQWVHINLKVKGQDGSEVFFRIKRSTQMRKLMNAYCDRQSVDFNAIAFLYDGRVLRAEQTPGELNMEDGDEIKAFLRLFCRTCLSLQMQMKRNESSSDPGPVGSSSGG